ncbi:MAG: hypothetical protein LBE10_00565 [Treponema sp.]|jgi:hypothetical protein|nr:hypothetical protein [Treponema sp.]
MENKYRRLRLFQDVRFWNSFLLFFYLVLPLFLPAQDLSVSGARIFYAEGSDFVLSSGGQRTVYQGGDLRDGGLLLNSGDIVQTGTDSRLEMQFSPSGTVIKLGENTSFLFTDTRSLGLFYGRLRIVSMNETDPVNIEAGFAVLSIKNSDAGIDYSIERGELKPRVRSYCFQGSAGMTISGQPGPPLNEMELVSVELRPSTTWIEKRPLEEEIVVYWNQNRFSGTPAIPLSEQAAEVLQSPAEISRRDTAPVIITVQPDYMPFFLKNRLKNILTGIGLFSSLGGLGVQAYGMYKHFSEGYSDQNIRLITYGTIPVAAGLGVILSSLFINPKEPSP